MKKRTLTDKNKEQKRNKEQKAIKKKQNKLSDKLLGIKKRIVYCEESE